MPIDCQQASQVAHRVARRFLARKPLWGNYCMDLTLEAMLTYGETTGENDLRDAALDVLDRRGWLDGSTEPSYRAQPFCHVNYLAYQITGNAAMVVPFVRESERYRANEPRSHEGAILHVTKLENEGAVLIDSMQDYASRMVHTGVLTGDSDWFREGAEQYRIHRDILRNPETGLWHNGRGFLADPQALSPGGWSRGHGWLIRGMADCLLALPHDSAEFATIRDYLIETLEALAPRQLSNGMFAVLLHRDPSESYLDVSGTAMIAYHTAACIAAGIIDDQWRDLATHAWNGCQAYIDDDGVIHSVSPGPGTLRGEEGYLHGTPISEDGKGHAPFAVIFAAAGMHQLAAKAAAQA